MAINVNPVPQLRIPKRFLDDPEAVSFFKQQNTIIFQLRERTGGNSDLIDSKFDFNLNGFSSYVQQLQKQINGLPEYTIDTTGFTIDTTLITTDKVTA